MNKYFILIVFLTFQLQTVAQESQTLKGRVQDAETGEPVPFASMGLKNNITSTVSNLQGVFEFHLPEKSLSDTLIISSIGFQNLSIAISEVNQQIQTVFKLKKSNTILDDVIITDSLSGEEIMNLTIDRISLNYPSFPISMSAFYREAQAADNAYVSLVEAAITIYDENNIKKGKSPLRTKIKVDQLRKSLGYKHPYNSFWEQDNLLMHLYSMNPVPNRLKRFKNYKVVNKQTINSDNESLYVITLQTDEPWPTTLFVQSKSYAILKIEQNYNHKIDGVKTWLLNSDTLDVTVNFKNKKSVVEFKEYQGNYYLNRISLDTNMDYTYKEEVLVNFRIVQDVIVNDIEIDNPIVVKRDEAMRLGRSLKNSNQKYDERFWENYNILQETPIEKKLVKDLEKEISLREQFKQTKQ